MGGGWGDTEDIEAGLMPSSNYKTSLYNIVG